MPKPRTHHMCPECKTCTGHIHHSSTEVAVDAKAAGGDREIHRRCRCARCDLDYVVVLQVASYRYGTMQKAAG